MTTAREVAEWMAAELEHVESLYQEEAVYRIAAKFGSDFVYQNENGNLAIDRGVLHAFRKLTDDSVVWEKTERCWRKRIPSDPPGRRTD